MNQNQLIQKMDVLRASVSANLKDKGCFVQTKDGITAFMPEYNLRYGTEVLCSVFKVRNNKYPLVMLDSIIYETSTKYMSA